MYWGRHESDIVVALPFIYAIWAEKADMTQYFTR